VRIREAGEADAEAVTALWTEAYSGAGPEGRKEPYALAEYFAVAVSAAVSVAEDEGGEVVAVVALLPPGAAARTVAGPGEAELARLAVAGEALGAEAIALYSRRHQTDAHRLYESLGYRRVPERDEDDDLGRRLVFRLDL
jgi:ribosomal protein S18 acetylase RimI-like enzyme